MDLEQVIYIGDAAIAVCTLGLAVPLAFLNTSRELGPRWRRLLPHRSSGELCVAVHHKMLTAHGP